MSEVDSVVESGAVAVESELSVENGWGHYKRVSAELSEAEQQAIGHLIVKAAVREHDEKKRELLSNIVNGGDDAPKVRLRRPRTDKGTKRGPRKPREPQAE